MCLLNLPYLAISMAFWSRSVANILKSRRNLLFLMYLSNSMDTVYASSPVEQPATQTRSVVNSFLLAQSSGMIFPPKVQKPLYHGKIRSRQSADHCTGS